MTLIEAIGLCREELADEPVGVRRSWEEMFRYTLRHCDPLTALNDFDPIDLERRLIASGANPPIVDGYVKRWQALVERHGR